MDRRTLLKTAVLGASALVLRAAPARAAGAEGVAARLAALQDPLQHHRQRLFQRPAAELVEAHLGHRR